MMNCSENRGASYSIKRVYQQRRHGFQPRLRFHDLRGRQSLMNGCPCISPWSAEYLVSLNAIYTPESYSKLAI